MSDGDQDEEPPVETSAGADDAPDADAPTDDLAFEDDGALDDSALDQSEIDDLFGIGAGGDESPNTGLQALLASRHIEHKRLPLLEACFDRLVHALTKSMRTFTSGDVELTLVDASSVRFGGYVEAIPLPAFVSVFKAIEWNEYGLISVDSPLIYAIIDVLLGGRRTAASLAVEARSFTSIEAMLIERLIVLVVKEMTSAFKPLADVEFRHERLESNPSRVDIASPSTLSILFEIDVHMDSRGGRIEILIPYTTLEPVRDLLQQMFMGEKFGQDSIWESHWSREMLLADVELQASFGELTVPLREIMALEVGSTLTLHDKPQDPVTLRCGDVSLMRAKAGRVGDKIAIQVDEWLDQARHPAIEMG